MIGQTISHYKILEKLGEGGMGVVYKAEDTKLRRSVALKFLSPNILVNEDDRRRFVHEAQACAALSHPNIATVFEIDESEAKTFIALEYIEGQSVAEKIKAGPLKLEDALVVAIQTCEGLQAAHEKGIVHRDIKSQNIMVTSRDQVKILDFGLAKLRGATIVTKAGTALGTMGYMSPEQLRGEPVDHRTDIWALGVVLYEMIAGRRPFQADYEDAVAYQMMNQQPESLTAIRTGLPMELERIVNKLLSKNAGERYQSVTDLLVDLRALRRTSDSGISHAPVPSSVSRSKGFVISIGVLLLFVAAGVLYYMLTPRPSGPIRSLAVLPFVNLSNIADQEYFADGMTEQLINTLGQVGALRIISRTSIIQYKQTKKGLKEIAKELNVDAVVEGSVQREGERVRISAQLIRAPEDRQLWAQSYERELREVLLLQGEIAQAIVGQVKAKLTAQEKTRVTSAKPVDPEAQDAYLRGSYFQNQWTEQSIRHAIGYFEQAVAHDSTYAQAYAGLAEANMTLGGAGIEVESPADGYRKGRPFLLKALALDEDNADAHMWMANLKSESDLDYAGAEKEYRRVLELNPNHAVAMCGYAQLMNTLGRYEEALAATKRAVEVDPLTPWVHSSLVIRYTCAGRYEEALAEARRALASNPNFWITYWAMGKTYQEMGRWNEAIAADQKAVELSEGNANVRGDLGFALARAGRREAALGVLKAFDDEARMHHIPAYARAVVYSGLGDNEAAIAWLEKAESEHSEMVKWISFKGNFSEIRDDPRFRAIMCRMKLPGACQ